jgi:cell pole-organizing protein PopZ
MNQPAKAQEPTMEEILASIRRIIADDDTGKPPPKAVEVPPPPVAVRPPEPPPPPPMPAPAPPPPPAPEPAMRQDDIDAMLSSLNRAAPPPPEPPAPDILDLTESMATAEPEPAEPSFRTIDGQSDVVFDERPYEPPPRRPLALDTDALLSASTTSAVDSAFNTLAHTVLVQNARTLEDLVREMLRPMLKGWLDDNLPGLVERLVRAEIERVSRGRT